MKKLVETIEPNYIKGTGVSIEMLNIRYQTPHRHRYCLEMICCLEGSVRVTIAHETMVLKQSEMVTADHDDVHYIESEEDNKTLIIHIDLDNPKHDRDEIDATMFSCATELASKHQLPYLEKIYDTILSLAYIYASGNIDDYDIDQIKNNLIDIMVERFSWFSVMELDTDENEKYRERLNALSLYVQRGCKQKLTLGELSKVTHLDSNYLSQFLKRSTMKSFTFFINYFRCYEAERLLLETDMSVQMISDACGFSSKNYLHKYFKSMWNITPLQHRKKYSALAEREEEYIIFSREDMMRSVDSAIIFRHIKKTTTIRT